MTNADIYLTSARMAMARQPQHVNLYVENYKKYLSRNVVQFGTYDEQIDNVLLNVRHQVKQMAEAKPNEGWAFDDYDSVTWFLGMFAKGLSEFLNNRVSFEKIFKDSFNRHFAPYGMD